MVVQKSSSPPVSVQFGSPRGSLKRGDLSTLDPGAALRRKIPDETVTVRETDGPLTATEARQWTEAQIAYPNLAGNESVDVRVLAYVAARLTEFENKAQILHRRWRITNHLLRGNTIYPYGVEDVHAPIVYIARENLVPRLEEAIHGYDPWFRVKGRDATDPADEDNIQAFLEWELDQMRHEDDVQPAIRSMTDYHVAVFKMHWKRDIEEVVKKEVVKKEEKNGATEYQIKRTLEEVVMYDGPAATLVDPYDFFIDTKASSVQKATFIGDSSWWELDDLEKMADLGLFNNIDKLKEEPSVTEGQEAAHYTEDHKRVRSITERFSIGQPPPEGGSKIVRVREVWCKFDLYGDGKPRECVLTVANDRICIRAQENFFDDKMRPYAVARSAKEGFDFFNVGHMDHAVFLNQEMDYHRSLYLEAHKQSVCPLAFAEEESDLPVSLLGIKPGTVFTAVGKVTFTKIPDTLQSAPFMYNMLRTEIEEASGAPRIFEGSGEAGNTATEVERRVKEGNRRIRSLVRAMTRMYQDMLRVMHSMNRQFVIKKTKFRVLGKKAARMGAYSEIGPETLLKDVDFEFVGVSNLHTLGTRATGLMNLMKVATPFMLQYPDVVDIPEIIREVAELTVGDGKEVDLVRSITSPDQLVPPELENEIMATGKHLEPDPQEDHKTHLKVHMEDLRERSESDDFSDREEHVKKRHIMRTLELLMKQQVQQQAQEGRVPATPMPLNPAGAAAGGAEASPPAGGFASSGNPGTTPQGQAAGPPDGAKVGNAARGGPGPIFQTDDILARR